MAMNDPRPNPGRPMQLDRRDDIAKRLLEEWEAIGTRLARLPPSAARDEVREKFDEICALLADLGYRRLM